MLVATEVQLESLNTDAFLSNYEGTPQKMVEFFVWCI